MVCRNKWLFLVITCVIYATNLHAQPLNFIDDDFEKFVERIVLNQDARQPFKAYYSNLSDTLKQQDEHKRKATYRYLLRLAMANLRAKNIAWYKAIEPYLVDETKIQDATCNDQRVKVTMFLIRYGAYEEFKSLAQAHNISQAQKFQMKVVEKEESWWDGIQSTLKSLFSSASNTVAGWFGYGNQQTT